MGIRITNPKITYFNTHSHTWYSNLRLLDCINDPIKLINKAYELGLNGIAITDHEALCSHMQVNKFAKKFKEEHPDFTIALGNEIYLVDERKRKQKYYHFILIAKDEIGYQALKELSSIAWYNMYTDVHERVPLLKSELAEVMTRYKGHVIATSACIGGELSQNALKMELALKSNDNELAREYYNNIIEFISFCQNVFGDDFYIECAPAANEEQIIVNRKLKSISEFYNIPMVVGTDAHYLRPEDRYVHKAFLQSQEGDREVDGFYDYTYLMTPEECMNFLSQSFDEDFILKIFENTLKLQSKIDFYSLEKHQEIPEVEVINYPRGNRFFKDEEYNLPITKSLFNSDNRQERYWINQCYEALVNKNIGLNPQYMERLEEEARVKRVIGEKLQTCMFAYPNTLQHYIDLFWRCGSTVGAGRGSACSGLNHYLLGITQLDPIKWELPFWRLEL